MADRRRGSSQGRPPARRATSTGGRKPAPSPRKGSVGRPPRRSGVAARGRVASGRGGRAGPVRRGPVQSRDGRPGRRPAPRREEAAAGRGARRVGGFGALRGRPSRRGAGEKRAGRGAGIPRAPGRGAPARRAPARRRTGERPALRTVGKRTGARHRAPGSARRAQARGTRQAPTQARPGRRAAGDGTGSPAATPTAALGTLMAAADAFAHDREREAPPHPAPAPRAAARLAERPGAHGPRPVPDRELRGPRPRSSRPTPISATPSTSTRCSWTATGPAKRWRKVEELWHELASVSPTAELVAEGRIVYAGALADQGRLPEALALLRKRAEHGEVAPRAPPAALVRPRRPRGAGRQPRPRPRAASTRCAGPIPAFADVAERLATLG